MRTARLYGLLATCAVWCNAGCHRGAAALVSDAAAAPAVAPAVVPVPVAVAAPRPLVPVVDASAPHRLSADDRARAAKLRALLARGRAATRAGRYPEAIAAFDALVAAGSSNARPLAERGYAKLLAGDTEGAEADLYRAQTLTSDKALRAQIAFNLGLAWEKRGNAEGALEAFALSQFLVPSRAAAAKIAGASACPAVVETGDLGAFQVADDWRAAYAILQPDLEDPDAGDPPASEAEARDRICEPRMNEHVCEGAPPWRLATAQMAFETFESLFGPIPGGKLWIVRGTAGGGECSMGGDSNVFGLDATLEGGVLTVTESSTAFHNVPVDPKLDGGADDPDTEYTCEAQPTQGTVTFAVLPRGKAVRIQRLDGLTATVEKDPLRVVVKGLGCALNLPLVGG